MKKLIITITACIFFAANIAAQEESCVEKSIFGVQAGVIGIWGYNESKLSNTIALRSEMGFEMTNWTIGRSFYGNDDEAHIPLVLSMEPRYYFDIKRRHSEGLRTDNNSIMFLSVKINYHADRFMLSGKQPGDVQIIPTIAGRFDIGKYLDIEIGGGMGYQYTFTSIEEEKDIWAFNIVLRIGYTF
ncbi:MAG: hypothetical protein LBV74_04360 [Tannerella sp.]|nr:hypothetical protein [Tannerella sp.]